MRILGKTVTLLAKLLLCVGAGGGLVALAVVALARPVHGLVTRSTHGVAIDETDLGALSQNSTVYASDGSVLAVLHAAENRVSVPLSAVPPSLINAIVDTEDAHFFTHGGVDLRGSIRALPVDIKSGGVAEGGSTITQQLVKNAFYQPERNLDRKIQEAVIAMRLERSMTKQQILERYLNTIYFGNGAYGVQQAALTYFHHGADTSHLTLPEAALLAGIPSDPARYDPVANPSAARDRREVVLRDMLDQNDITYSDFVRADRAPLPEPNEVHLPGKQGPAPYFTNYVKQQLIDRYGSGRVFGGGLRVRTTIDLNVQRFARRAITKWLPDPKGPAAALVAIDPRDGSVLAMIGGNSYHKSQFNLAVQGERQPGSSFKPFVLATALKEGISPDTDFESGPIDIPFDNKVWAVHNYENEDLGRISLATATAVSDNTVFAQLTQLVGPVAVARTARRLGITSPLKSYFAIGLGAEAVNPLEMARAFSAFANGGGRVDGSVFGNRPRAIATIRNENGRLVDWNRGIRRQVLTENTAALVTSLLQGVIRSGTGKRAQLADGRPVAGKTGTTENYGDAWFVGYTPQLVAAVWVGYPNRLRPMLTEYHGDSVAGGTFPALIWKSFMERALPYLHDEPQDFPAVSLPYAVPKLVVLRNGRLELDNGNCRSTREILYFEGQQPARTADCKVNEVDVPRIVGDTVAEARSRLAAQPLTPAYVYEPAKPRQRLGVVLRQYPARGTLSSYDKVTLVLPKALHGAVPKVVGLPLARAEGRLGRLHLKWKVAGDARAAAKVLQQKPGPRTAAAPGLVVTLVVAAG